MLNENMNKVAKGEEHEKKEQEKKKKKEIEKSLKSK